MTNKNENQLNNISVLATLTTTSNKTDGDFKQDVPTKTGYWSVTDINSLEKLKANGFTEYGKEDKFFIIKMAQNVRVYTPSSQYPIENVSMCVLDENQENTPNYSTKDKQVRINIVQGMYMKKPFFRVNAVLSEGNPFVRLEAENPFAEFMQFDSSQNNKQDPFGTSTQIDISEDDLPF